MCNEWLVVQSDTGIPTRKRTLDAGDGIRRHAFPDTLRRVLPLHTRPLASPATDQPRSPDLAEWIRDRHDTARIDDASSQLVAALQY